MTTRMLINAQRPEQLRVAIVQDTHLEGYETQFAEGGLTRGNIYRGIVANVQASLNAAFIDIGEERHGFLPAQDVLPSAFHKKQPEDRRPRIDQVLERGKPLLVQVTKDGIGQKGPALTTNVSLAGRYLVLTPYDSVRGISRKADDDDARKTIRERLKKLNLADNHGVILRTNGLEQNLTTLNRDLGALSRLWKKIRGEANKGSGIRLLYSDQDLILQALRDHLDSSISQVIVDDDEAFAKAEAYMQAFMPRSKTELVSYSERVPLFSRYRIETQIDRIHDRTVTLPGGGSIVIDGTEALTAIDVNSGRATKSGDHEDSIFAVNVEAANEVGRQLRLRDIGGLVVVDFIDMRLRKHQRKLEKEMRDAMKADRARHSVGRISDNGLLEINRQRIKTALQARSQRPCPTCRAIGTIPTVEFSARGLLRRIEARAASGVISGVTLALHPEIANALQNLYRAELASLEREFQLTIEIIGAPNLSPLEQRVDWVHRQVSEVVVPISAALTATDLALPARKRRPATKVSEGAEKKLEASGAIEGTDSLEEEGQEGPPKRKRRRRRRGSGAKAKAAKAAKAAEEAGVAAPESGNGAGQSDDAQPAIEAHTDEAPEPRRRPSRRRRSSRAGEQRPEHDTRQTGEGLEAPLVATAGDDEKPAKMPSIRPTPPRAADVEVASETAAAAGGEDPPKPKPARRRRRRTAKKSIDEVVDAQVAALETGVSEAKTGEPKETPKPRPARIPEDSAQVEIQKVATTLGNSNGSKGTTEPKDDGAIRVVATPPAEGLRWQWWGGAGGKGSDEPSGGPAEGS